MSDKSISPSLEDYIEAIYLISKEQKVARVKDISTMLGVKRPSVTGALKNLSSMKMTNHTPYSFVTLTEKGKQVGKEIVKRHTVIKLFFTDVLGIEVLEAEDAACRIEHSVNEEILGKLLTLIEFIKCCPRIGVEWVRKNMADCKLRSSDTRCKVCIKNCLDDVKKGTC